MTFILTLTLIFFFWKRTEKNDKIRENLESEVKNLREEIGRVKENKDKSREVLLAELKTAKAEIDKYEVIIQDLEKTIATYSDEEREYRSEMDNLDSLGKEITPEELLILRDKSKVKGSGVHDFTGIYILENKTEDKFYVGQSISVLKRASRHFTGEGNEDIYEDYKAGSFWTVKMIALSDSGFKSINALEKHFIKYHSSTYNGYNKTIGNSN